MENVTTKTILGRHTIIRRRVSKKRPVSYVNGKCYRSIHGGKWSFYIAKAAPQKKVNVSINDK